MSDNKPVNTFFSGAKGVSASNNRFQNVAGNFTEYVTNNYTAAPSLSVSHLKLYPAGKLSQFFIGHVSYLQNMKDTFFVNGDESTRKYLLLHGKSGVGKTQICLKFIHDTQQWLSNILWIDASTEKSILSSLRVISEELQLSNTSSPLHILSKISNLEGLWLLVFDNAVVGSETLGNYFPPGHGGCILITSRTNDFERLIGHQSLLIGEMEEDVAIGLLLKSGHLGPSSKDIARKFASKLGFMPHLIDQAGHYIYHHKCDPEKLLDLEEGVIQSNASEEFIMVLKNKENSKEIDTVGAVDADTLLVWHNLAYSYYTQKKYGDSEKWGLKVVEGRKKLLGVDHSYTLLSMANLGDAYREHGKYEKSIEIWLQVANKREANLGKDHKDTFYSYHQVAYGYYKDKKWADAESWGLKAVEGRKKLLGINHSHTLLSMSNLGLVYNEQKQHDKAVEIRHLLVEGRTSLLGENHADTLLAIHNLAWSLYCQKKWTDAEKWGLKAVEGRKKLLGINHAHTLTSLANLASVYIELSKLEELTQIRLQILEGKTIAFGENHPDTLQAMSNAAAAYTRQKNWVEAEKLGSKVVEGRKKLLGANHLDTLLTMLILADTYTELNKWDEAQELYTRVIEQRTAQLGATNSLTLDAMRRFRNSAKKQPGWA